MPYPLEFLDAESVIFPTPTTPYANVPLTVGANFEDGDMRLVRVFILGTNTFGTPPVGWTKVADGTATGCRVGFFITRLVSGATDAVMPFVSTSNYLIADAVTVRNANFAQSFVPVTNPGTATSATAPSVTMAAGGVLLIYSMIENASCAVPAGMRSLASTADSTNSATQFAGLTYLSAGASGTKVSAGSGTSVPWFATSLALIQNPDISSTITAAAETDAGVAVTSALASLVTNVVTPAQEVDTALEVYNPLRAVSIRPPVLLTGNPVTASRVTWQASTPAAGSAVLVETSLDNGASWQTALNGGAVPGLLRGDATTPVVLTRATMTRLLSTDTSPFFMTLKTEVSEDTSYNELVALGTFLITQVDITETGGPTGGGSGGGGGGSGVTGTGGSSTGGGLSLVVSGIDLSYAISRNTWTEIFYVPANTNYATAMLEIAQNRLPGITSDVASTEVTAQRLLFGTSQGADPWQDVQDMGTAIGSRAYFDPVGTFKVKPVADPALTPSVWTVSDAANPVMVSYTRSISDSTTYNYVVVSGESTSNAAPVSAVAFDADPSSPTYYLGPYNIVTTTFISAMITTTAQAQQAADALLLVVKGASETVQITMVPNPALEPGDVITVTRTYNGQPIIQGTFKINSMSTPIGQAQAQVLVCYRQSAAQG